MSEDRPDGTVTWEEHVAAWQDYRSRFGDIQSAERIAQRGGFSYSELVDHLGRPPETWLPRTSAAGTGHADPAPGEHVCPDCQVERADYGGPDGAWLPACPNCGSTSAPQPVGSVLG